MPIHGRRCPPGDRGPFDEGGTRPRQAGSFREDDALPRQALSGRTAIQGQTTPQGIAHQEQRCQSTGGDALPGTGGPFDDGEARPRQASHSGRRAFQGKPVHSSRHALPREALSGRAAIQGQTTPIKGDSTRQGRQFIQGQHPSEGINANPGARRPQVR